MAKVEQTKSISSLRRCTCFSFLVFVLMSGVFAAVFWAFSASYFQHFGDSGSPLKHDGHLAEWKLTGEAQFKPRWWRFDTRAEAAPVLDSGASYLPKLCTKIGENGAVSDNLWYISYGTEPSVGHDNYFRFSEWAKDRHSHVNLTDSSIICHDAWAASGCLTSVFIGVQAPAANRSQPFDVVLSFEQEHSDCSLGGVSSFVFYIICAAIGLCAVVAYIMFLICCSLWQYRQSNSYAQLEEEEMG